MVRLGANAADAITALLRADGEYFCGHAPEVIVQYYTELKRYALEPLMAQGLTLDHALQVEHAARLHSIRCVLGDILGVLQESVDAERD